MFKKVFFLAVILTGISLSSTAQNNYAEVSLPELMQKLRQGQKDMVILDVRSKGEYNDTSGFRHLNIGRIKGAINIPIQDLQQNPEAIRQLDEYKDKEIYVICSHSYRSRTVSNLLLKNNFTKINNVQGGMSEWFRNHDELAMYAASYYEKSIPYSNISPSKLFSRMRNKDSVVFIGFKNAPRSSFDSLITAYVAHFPDLKNTEFYTAKDSAAVMAKAKNAKGKPIVTFNIMGTGGGEIAGWLAQNGIPNVNYLVGNLTGFYEYFVNYQYADKVEDYFIPKNNIQFYSGLSLCRVLERNKPIQLVDLRHDTLFAKPTVGTKLTYNHIKGAVNFPFYRSASDFEKQFPDKDREYVLLPHQGYVGIELADALLVKGYKIGWLMGGNERFEWYANNVNLFTCKQKIE